MWHKYLSAKEDSEKKKEMIVNVGSDGDENEKKPPKL
jgi:hypothetical protein